MRFAAMFFLIVCLVGCDQIQSFNPQVGHGTHVETKYWMGSPYVRMKNAAPFTLYHPCAPKTCAECSGTNARYAHEIGGREVIPKIEFERNAWCRLDVTPENASYRGEIRLHVAAYIASTHEAFAVIEYHAVPHHDWDDETLSCEDRDRLFHRHAQARFCPSGAVIDVPIFMLEEMQRAEHEGKYIHPMPVETIDSSSLGDLSSHEGE